MKPFLAIAPLLALLAAAPPARAEEGPGAFDASAAPGQQWKDQFGFTDAQYRKYAAAEKSKEDEFRPLRGRLRDALLTLRTLVAAKAPDEKVAAALKELAKAQEAVAEANKKFDAGLTAFLSPTQRAKLLIAMPSGDLDEEAGVEKRAGGMHEALTDGDLEQE